MNTERMGRTMAAALLALVLTLGAGSTAVAQEEAAPPPAAEVQTDDGFDWGWLGLLGLIGLAGLRGRSRDDTTAVRRDTTRTDAGPRDTTR